MEKKAKHIMAIGAHIGDAELTCGKTLATHYLLGDKITSVAVTAGERGAPPEKDIEEFKAHNISCAKDFAQALGGNFFCLNYPDGQAPDNDELRYAICDLIRAEKPDVILTHWHHSMHKDHITTARAVEDAIYYAALRGFKTDTSPHFAQGPYYAENWEDSHGFQPYIFIDVSPGYDLWHANIQKLWLTNNSPWFKYRQHYEALAESRGALVHKKYAECFDVSPYSKKIVKDSF